MKVVAEYFYLHNFPAPTSTLPFLPVVTLSRLLPYFSTCLFQPSPANEGLPEHPTLRPQRPGNRTCWSSNGSLRVKASQDTRTNCRPVPWLQPPLPQLLYLHLRAQWRLLRGTHMSSAPHHLHRWFLLQQRYTTSWGWLRGWLWQGRRSSEVRLHHRRCRTDTSSN
jgi:hypothetical protein